MDRQTNRSLLQIHLQVLHRDQKPDKEVLHLLVVPSKGALFDLL